MAPHHNAGTDNYPKLSLPFENMETEYDVVVVGSGYGAGVAASRMARAGKRVAVLELGSEKRPGMFPRTLCQCLRELSIAGSSKRNSILQRWPFSGDPTRLFQLVLGEGQHAFLAHGLGGGSLINAGVFLEADQATLQMSPWPVDIRDNPSELQPYYERAATMLQPSEYPLDYPRLKKLDHLQEQSGLLNDNKNFYRVPVTTFFHSGRNHAGVRMNANSGSGHECTGQNDGSKNSVPTTYLVDAWYWGAEIFCGCEVRYVEKATDGTGYVVYFARHTPGRTEFQDYFGTQLFWIKAREWCFLGAGALGTTEILLRSKRNGLPLSPMVGRNMTGNGDMLIFGYNGNSDINGISGDHSDSTAETGPTVTGIIDNREKDPSKNALQGYVVEDGCIPQPFAPVIQAMLMAQTFRREVTSALWCPRQHIGKAVAAFKSLVMGPYTPKGAIRRTSTYLVMSHDSNELTLTLKGDKLCFRGPAAGGSRVLKNIQTALSRVLSHVSANMGHSYFYGRDQEEVTVHVLGGANMSRNGTGRGGVTDHRGQVFTGHGSEVYPGLVCCDGSVIPTSLGVNPLATITALAERSITLLADYHRIPIDLGTANGNLDRDSVPKGSGSHSSERPVSTSNNRTFKSIGWQFTEVLEGYMTTQRNIVDFAASEAIGKGSSSALRMFLTVEIGHDLSVRGYEGRCTGTVSCRALSSRALKVVGGTVRFFVKEKDCADSTTLAYSMRLISVEGQEYCLEAHKQVNSRASLSVRSMWNATTTVSTVISHSDGTRVGAGVLRISVGSFYRQMRSFRMTKSFSLTTLLALLIFLAVFAIHILVVFLRPIALSWGVGASRAGFINAPERPSKIFTVNAKDGVGATLEVYESRPVTQSEHQYDVHSPPILFLPGITGIGAAHSIFTLPFQRCNMVDYFTARGSRCYVLTPRWSCEARVAEECTVFDARLDIAAALQHINHAESQPPYVIAHCQGSVALGMGILDGLIQRSQLLGVTANSVFMNQAFGYWNSVKGASPVLIRLYEFLDGRYFPIAFSKSKDILQRILDVILRLYPVHRRRDICTSAACHRTSFAFGLLWNHDNLDAHIHDNIDRFFAGTHTKLLEHLVRMGSRGQCLDNQLDPLLSSHSVRRLKGVPIMFMSGTENEVFRPESTLRDYELLRHEFGERLYQRFLVEGYGHLDPIVGKNAAEDVYWRVWEHFRWCTEYFTGRGPE